MARIVRSFRGISKRAARMYLEGLGGTALNDDEVEGNDWHATLSADTVEIGPSLTLTEVTITFEGSEPQLTELIELFEKKAIRAGG